MNMPGQLFVISGPSGAGKSSIVKALLGQTNGLVYSISHTSRRPRGREKNGIEYHFVDAGTFNRMIEAGAFVEWAKVYDDFYGTSFSNLKAQTGSGLDVLLDLDSQGAENIRKHFEDSVLIYILPPSLAILEKRLKGRATDDEGVIHMRMEKALNDMDNCLWYDYIIINDDLEKATTEAKSIIISERCRTARQMNAQTLLETFRK
jgi:guanylate kinase